jgi:hypothetical protein
VSRATWHVRKLEKEERLAFRWRDPQPLQVVNIILHNNYTSQYRFLRSPSSHATGSHLSKPRVIADFVRNWHQRHTKTCVLIIRVGSGRLECGKMRNSNEQFGKIGIVRKWDSHLWINWRGRGGPYEKFKLAWKRRHTGGCE